MNTPTPKFAATCFVILAAVAVIAISLKSKPATSKQPSATAQPTYSVSINFAGSGCEPINGEAYVVREKDLQKEPVQLTLSDGWLQSHRVPKSTMTNGILHLKVKCGNVLSEHYFEPMILPNSSLRFEFKKDGDKASITPAPIEEIILTGKG